MSDKPTLGILVADKKIVGSFSLPPGTRDGSLPRPPLPPDTVPLHRTPRADGLAIDTSVGRYALKRRSPFRNRWPDVCEFDERVAQLEAKQAGLNAELVAAREQLTRAREADRESLARWVADSSGDRPLPAAPGVAQRITDLEQERDALTTATEHVLDAKTAYVEKHRGRLVREAGKARARAVEQLGQAITAVEEVRAEAADCVAAQRWATEYPGEAANPSGLRLELVKGGRLSSALSDYKGLAVASQVTEWLRDDARWLGNLLEREQEKQELDPHHEAVWEQSPEGRKAVVLANKRVEQSLRPKNTRQAGWEN